MKPSMTELRAFATVAETGHFTRAAEQLGLSQSALSAAIVKLEKLMGTRLFDRHTRTCRPTDAGVALLPATLRLLADWDQLLASGRDFAANARGRVDVAAPNAQCALLLPPVIKAFRAAHPNVRLVLHDVPEHEVHALVRKGTADLGIATQTDARADLLLTPLATDQFIVAMSPEHRLASRRALEWSQLAREPVIGYLPGNPVRHLLDEKLAERGIKLDYVHEVALPWTAIGLAREGLGVAVVTMALRPLAAWHGLAVLPVSRPQLARTLGLLRAPGNTLSPAAAAFRECLLGRPQPATAGIR
ncbi:LysR family transcriptional regulator [Paucibacter sp. R3-3]|uniref:LysR family transcriptional regulator n=1 Tax=Roseateles agri TaxID=3098619 RepID=A0ABU5DIK5_9BURK|nr:LysR family transcriptional regulator [Paucibacter sp. R3-3]MDY0746134.1 LysR family transcriptional regulator [Paucibacter sp. R3-3]